jgi:hypothetical protein
MNKKTLFIILGIVLIALGWELIYELLEWVVEMVVEWTHKGLDFLFEEIIELEEEDAKTSAAWTGLFLLISLAGFGCYKLYQIYRFAKVWLPQWWFEQKASWALLPITLKLAYVAGGLALFGILSQFML